MDSADLGSKEAEQPGRPRPGTGCGLGQVSMRWGCTTQVTLYLQVPCWAGTTEVMLQQGLLQGVGKQGKGLWWRVWLQHPGLWGLSIHL